MPTHITLPLKSDPAAPFPAYPHRALQASLFRWLAAADPARADRVHDEPGPKPFAIAPLSRRNGTLCYTFSLLDDDLWPGRSVRRVTGATLTVQALTDAVRRALALDALVLRSPE